MAEYKFSGNFFDSEFPEDIEENLEDLDEKELIQDSDGDYYYENENGNEREYLDLIWYEIYHAECPTCNKKWLSVIDRETANSHRYNTDYCLDCGYPRGIINYDKLSSREDIKDVLDLEGVDILDETREIIQKIYPSISRG